MSPLFTLSECSRERRQRQMSSFLAQLISCGVVVVVSVVSGRSGITRWGGGRGQYPTWVLFGENVCKNERIGPSWGAMPRALPGSATVCRQVNKCLDIQGPKQLFHDLNAAESSLRFIIYGG